MSSAAWLVVVTGPAASGKSTLARRLAEELRLPLIAKDDLKVILYETLGWGGRERDRRTSDAAYELIYHLAETELRADRSVMLESNFRPEAAGRFAALQQRYGAGVIQIRCFASREVLVRRLEERVASEGRHPGHADAETLAGELDSLLSSGARLELNGPFLEVDTGVDQVDPAPLAVEVRKLAGL